VREIERERGSGDDSGHKDGHIEFGRIVLNRQGSNEILSSEKGSISPGHPSRKSSREPKTRANPRKPGELFEGIYRLLSIR
jgi:hypothetical protein